jgi:hypothetical protein
MKVWNTTLSSTEVQRLVAEQELTIQELRENNKKLSDASMHWMTKFAETKANEKKLQDLVSRYEGEIAELIKIMDRN